MFNTNINLIFFVLKPQKIQSYSHKVLQVLHSQLLFEEFENTTERPERM
jgi:hypothetical protein